MKKQTKQWTTKSGQKIRICDMTNEHLLNTIKLLYRYSEHLWSEATKAILGAPAFVGEMAQDAFDREFEKVINSTWENWAPSIFTNLVLDAQRRNLEVSQFIKTSVQKLCLKRNGKRMTKKEKKYGEGT